MPRRERYARMTAEQRETKLERQRRRRLEKPAVNGRLRVVLGDEDYLELYEQLLEAQDGGCGICGKEPGKHRLHMDHDHQTLEIRGLLCYSCNTKLGFLEKYLTNIVEYLSW